MDRRSLLLAGAGLLSACAASPDAADETPDVAFRRLVDALGGESGASAARQLRQVNRSRLTLPARILYEGVAQGADADAALGRLGWGAGGRPYRVTHRNGVHLRISSIREDESDVYVIAVDAETRDLIDDAALGVTPPDFVLDATIPAVTSAAQSALLEPLAQAFARQVEALRSLRANAGPEPGMWRLANGDEFYALSVSLQLGARTNPREAHARALARCRDLQAQADGLLRAQGFADGSVAERLRALARDERFLWTRDEAGKARAVTEMNAQIVRVRERLPLVLNTDDPSTMNLGVRRLDPASEADGTRGRRDGAMYLVDLGGVRPSWTLASVAHHEVSPGHILQAIFERPAGPPDLQRRYASGYSEGWATYAEQLADELGAMEDDPFARIGYLQWMLFRYGRVVADTGIHAMRWSRARAVRELRELQGDSIAFVSIEEDVLRMCAQPGVATAQGLAAMRIAEIREETRRRVGARFDARAFHTAMLRYGPLSPPGLAQAAQVAFT